MYTIRRTVEFAQWLDGLKDRGTRARLQARLLKVSRGLLGDVEPVGDGVYEMREHFGPGWRMYYVERSAALLALLVMLWGGLKRTQQADIGIAKAFARALED